MGANRSRVAGYVATLCSNSLVVEIDGSVSMHEMQVEKHTPKLQLLMFAQLLM